MRAFAAPRPKVASIVMWLALWPACHSPRAVASPCQPETVAIDTSYGEYYRSAWRGGSVGESFLATETLITSISVWDWTRGSR